MFKSANLEDIRNWAANHPVEAAALLGGALGGTAGAVVPTDGNNWKRVRNALLGAAGGAGFAGAGAAGAHALGSAATEERVRQVRDASYQKGYQDALGTQGPTNLLKWLSNSFSK